MEQPLARLPFMSNKMWGLFIVTGLFICCCFLALEFYSAFLKKVSIASAYGYIDKSGKLVINFKNLKPDDPDWIPTTMGAFHNQKAILSFGKQKVCYFIDATGKKTTGLYECAGEFNDGLAPARSTVKHLFGFIDEKGAFAIAPKYANARIFSENLAAVQDTSTRRWGFINKSGKIVVDCNYAMVGDFHDGLAFFTHDLKKFGYLDRNSNIIVEPVYDAIYDFSQQIGIAELTKKSGERDRHYFNQNGVKIFAKDVPRNKKPNGKVLAFSKSELTWNGEIGRINYAGDITTQEDPTFHSNYAVICTRQGYNFIDATGKQKSAEYFDFARPFHNNHAICFQNGQFLIIDSAFNKVKLPLSTLAVDDFHDDVALILQTKNLTNIINFGGKLVWHNSLESADINAFSEGLAATKGATLW
jgi:WG containing repeat